MRWNSEKRVKTEAMAVINALFKKISGSAGGKVVTILFCFTIAMMIIINTVDMAVSVPRIEAVSGGAEILDMKVYYTSDEAYKILDQLGTEGRRVYQGMLTEFDFIFPLLYALTLSMSAVMILGKLFPNAMRIQKLGLIPLLAGAFDWLENISALVMLANYPKVSAVSSVAGYFTLGKWGFTWLSLGGIMVGLTILTFKRKE
jgi:hypothetical protein